MWSIRCIAIASVIAVGGCGAGMGNTPDAPTPAPTFSPTLTTTTSTGAPAPGFGSRTYFGGRWTPGSEDATDPWFFTLNEDGILTINGPANSIDVGSEPDLRKLITDLTRVDAAWKGSK